MNRIMTVAIMVAAILVAAILVVGCSEQGNAPKKVQGDSQKPRTVVVNEGMSEEEEEKLNQRLDALEDEANDQPAEQTTQETRSPEDTAHAAAQAYYAAAASGSYNYTYNELSSYSQSQFTEDEWIAANTALGSDEASYSVDSISMVDDTVADVTLTITLPDGSSSGRTTRFILENGGWKHDLTQAEYDLFAGATATASASATSSASATADAGANTKHVTIIISSTKPADISIYDDSFNWAVNEEIIGSKTYERDIPANSGLSVSAITDAYNARTTIQVYEDGSLVARDSDPHGCALVTY